MAGERVLLAHGNADCRTIYGSVLTFEGYVVDAAGDMPAAENRLASGRYDLVVSDLYIPGPGEECLIRVIRSSTRTAHLPVLILTGWSGDVHRKLALDLGAERFLPFPIKPRELCAIVADIIGSPPGAIGAHASSSSRTRGHLTNGI